MSVQWQQWVSGQEIPGNAIKGGQEPSGEALYIARVQIEENGQDLGVHIGKIGETTGRGALVPFGGKEKYFGQCEILVGDENSIRWVERAGFPSFEGFNLVEGGRDNEGNTMAITQANFNGALCVGKVSTKMNGATVAFAGQEHYEIQEYKILCYQ